MKLILIKLRLIAIIILLWCNAYGQNVTIENLSLKNSKEFFLSSTYYNRVVVKYNRSVYDTVEVKGENIDIRKSGIGTDTVLIRVLDNQQHTIIRLYNHDSLIFQKEMFVDKNIRLPALTLGCYHCDIPEFSSCLCDNFDSLFCKAIIDKELKQPVYFTVLSFNVKMRSSLDEIYYGEYHCGNIFSEKAKAFAKTLRYKDQMLLDLIIIQDMYGNIYNCKSKKFTVLSER